MARIVEPPDRTADPPGARVPADGPYGDRVRTGLLVRLAEGVTNELADELAAAEEARGDLSDTDGDWAVVDGITCLRAPAPYPWASQAKVMWPRPAAAIRRAIRWLGMSPDHGRVMTRECHVDLPAFTALGLQPAFVLTAMAHTAPLPETRPISGLQISRARSADEVHAVLCAEDAGLAPLVTAAHVAAPSHRYMVARLDGEPVGCAQIRWLGGTAYLSAVTVLPAARGGGVGGAISTAATSEARARGITTVWLHARDHVQPLYQRLGYCVVDVHVQLGLSAPATTGPG